VSISQADSAKAAREINRIHSLIVEASQAGLQNAIDCGTQLLAVKNRLDHGQFEGAKPKQPNIARTTSLVANAQSLIPRLKFDASPYTVRSFLLDAKRIGLACEKFEGSSYNGWKFWPLADHRAAWEKLYGTQLWDADTNEWIA
jgi:hypothetical protein